MRSDWFIIGIAGATCSGKTTLARKLRENLNNSVLINQDDYFLPVDDSRHEIVPELNHLNWEILSSMDMPRMIEDVEKLISSPVGDAKSTKKSSERNILIMDGFLLFNCEKLADICDAKFFLDMTKEQCWERRKNRVYEPPDVPNYFEKIVWPEYVDNRSKILRNEKLSDTIIFIDGGLNEDDIFTKVFNEIKLRLKR